MWMFPLSVPTYIHFESKGQERAVGLQLGERRRRMEGKKKKIDINKFGEEKWKMGMGGE